MLTRNTDDYGTAAHVSILDSQTQQYESTFIMNASSLFPHRSKTTSDVTYLPYTAIDIEMETANSDGATMTQYALPVC